MSNSSVKPLVSYDIKRVGYYSALALLFLGIAGFNLYRITFSVRELDEYVWSLAFLTLQGAGGLLMLTAVVPVVIRIILCQPAAWIENGDLRWAPGWGASVALKDVESYSFKRLRSSRIAGLHIHTYAGKRVYIPFLFLRPHQSLVDLLRSYASDRADLMAPA